MNEIELKEILSKIKGDEWLYNQPLFLSNLTEKDRLLQECIQHIGSTDSELRDGLIYPFLCCIIQNGDMPITEKKLLLKKMLSKEHLFYKIGDVNSDSVFNRSFSILIITELLNVDNQKEHEFLKKEEWECIFKQVIYYVNNEKDTRGYVEMKGWAHSVAHTADALNELAKSRYINQSHYDLIIYEIKNKLKNKDYVYVNQEEERMLNVFVTIVKKDGISSDFFLNWLKDFGIFKENLSMLEHETLRQNQQSLLRSLYFRSLEENCLKRYSKDILTIVNKLPKYY